MSRRTSTRSASARLCIACHVVTKTPVRALTTTAIFGSITSVISGTPSRAKPKPATICMMAAMNTAEPNDDQLGRGHEHRFWHGQGRLRCRACCRSSISASRAAAADIDRACREFGFFAIRNHGVSDELRDAVLGVSIDFFGRDTAEKAARRPGPWRRPPGAAGSRSAAS